MNWILSNWLRKKKFEKFFNRVEEDFFENDKYRAYLEPKILESLKETGEVKPKRASRIVLACIRQSMMDKYLTENRYIRFLEDNSKEFFMEPVVVGSDVVTGYEELISNFIHNKQNECSDYILSHIPKYYRKFAKELEVDMVYPNSKRGEKEMLDDIIMILNHK
ncbi:hypothetical protein [Enterovibrio paralichthyis]|uniref:hypothetical protein n=1 Tax=Enterovibrio paralichthyis TaxID=2853805 RepID=UPI001C446D4E|nr:hypothetical protein [Enterovibrio paralichthyis]MBV7296621.1 hypothetical protein [Enterovibrio paralichthyis]